MTVVRGRVAELSGNPLTRVAVVVVLGLLGLFLSRSLLTSSNRRVPEPSSISGRTTIQTASAQKAGFLLGRTTLQTASAQKAGFQGIWLSMVLDESGSMQPVADSTRANFNKYIDGQKKSCLELQTSSGPDSFGCAVSLTKFDAPKIMTLYDRKPIQDTPALNSANYHPNGGTNLLDAVGDVITRIDNHLATLPDNVEARPAVLVVVLTDGEENSSRFFDAAMIRNLISVRRDLGWTFVFLGANIDAWKTAENWGIPSQNAYNFHVQEQDTLFESLAASSSNYANVQNSNRLMVKNGLDTNGATVLLSRSGSSSFFTKEARAKEYSRS